MPMSAEFEQRLYPMLERIVAHYGTPFHIYDEAGIRQNARALKQAFSGVDGLPRVLRRQGAAQPAHARDPAAKGFGADCSSLAELR